MDHVMQRIHHKISIKSEDQPYQYIPPNYGARQKYTEPEDEAPNLNESEKIVHQMTGKFLYCARAADSTMLAALNSISSEQANPTNTTMKKTKNFLNYVASHQDVIVTYHASDLIFACHIYASYLSKPKARIRVGGHFSYRRMMKPRETMGRY